MPVAGPVSRRAFLAASTAASLGLAATGNRKLPVGLELYSVRGALAKDLTAAVTAVAHIGYQVVEFYAPYFDWTPNRAKQVRKLLDGLGMVCHSTHNNTPSFTPAGISKAIDLNQILGAKYIVMASAGTVNGIDGWREVADLLTVTAEKLRPFGMAAGYHNHQAEWMPVEGQRPMDVLAGNTAANVMLQLDVGTCLQAGADPVEWIRSHPGRIRSVHCKDWAPGEGKGYRVLFGEGVAPWPQIFAAAESAGGVEYYLIEQEGSRFPELETAERCLGAWKRLTAKPA